MRWLSSQLTLHLQEPYVHTLPSPVLPAWVSWHSVIPGPCLTLAVGTEKQDRMKTAKRRFISQGRGWLPAHKCSILEDTQVGQKRKSIVYPRQANPGELSRRGQGTLLPLDRLDQKRLGAASCPGRSPLVWRLRQAGWNEPLGGEHPRVCGEREPCDPGPAVTVESELGVRVSYCPE